MPKKLFLVSGRAILWSSLALSGALLLGWSFMTRGHWTSGILVQMMSALIVVLFIGAKIPRRLGQETACVVLGLAALLLGRGLFLALRSISEQGKVDILYIWLTAILTVASFGIAGHFVRERDKIFDGLR